MTPNDVVIRLRKTMCNEEIPKARVALVEMLKTVSTKK